MIIYIIGFLLIVLFLSILKKTTVNDTVKNTQTGRYEQVDRPVKLPLIVWIVVLVIGLIPILNIIVGLFVNIIFTIELCRHSDELKCSHFLFKDFPK